MTKNPQSRKWLLTLNNPLEYGFSLDFCRSVLGSIRNLEYWCYAEEVGEKGTPHIHIFIYRSSSPLKFDTLKSRFPQAHFDVARGTCAENRDYVFKIGKWADDKKSETNDPDSHFEFGELPVERQGARNDLADLYDMIKDGLSDDEIINENPNFILQIDRLDKIRQSYREAVFRDTFRNLEVTYISGPSGVGKTRGILEQFGYTSVYRITDYQHPFDYYKGEKVLLFDEYRSNLKISDMLNYLDGYPLMLPSRYNNKVACYDKVFIVSNIGIEKQYVKTQNDEPETFRAFLRRIHYIYEKTVFGSLIEKTVDFRSFKVETASAEDISIFDKRGV